MSKIPKTERRPSYFPRLDNEKDQKDMDLVRWLRKEYPAPEWPSWMRWNPADTILDSSLTLSKKKLVEFCLKHSLEPGTRRMMVKRLWLHWRASRLHIGYPYRGYDIGYRNTRKPNCACGFLRADPRRFPRLPKRFPRLLVSIDGRIRFPRPE